MDLQSIFHLLGGGYKVQDSWKENIGPDNNNLGKTLKLESKVTSRERPVRDSVIL